MWTFSSTIFNACCCFWLWSWYLHSLYNCIFLTLQKNYINKCKDYLEKPLVILPFKYNLSFCRWTNGTIEYRSSHSNPWLKWLQAEFHMYIWSTYEAKSVVSSSLLSFNCSTSNSNSGVFIATLVFERQQAAILMLPVLSTLKRLVFTSGTYQISFPRLITTQENLI